ncbi:MAG: hypothetical protein C4545_06085 [Anaerolineaceae bacterium]|jgi:hypothetical protein|nr:MAG: hypothetical protein C4545_06085 [Anaerolineaceae bacterium]
MEKHIYDQICSQIHKKYPAVKNSKPEIKAQPNGDYLLIFGASQKTANGHSLSTILRVTADENGKIKKVSSSR